LLEYDEEKIAHELTCAELESAQFKLRKIMVENNKDLVYSRSIEI
jgi:hypothetical protein